jgi:peptide/nickel transport system permease protein
VRLGRGGVVAVLALAAIGALALAAPLLVPAHDLDPIRASGAPNRPPSWRLPLGSDGYGRPMTAVTLWGARLSLLVGLLATLVSVGTGTLVGLVAGHLGGWVGAVLMRVTDWFLVLPTLVLAAGLATVLGPGVGTVVTAIGLTSWPPTARLVRAQTRTLAARPFIERARALGAGPARLLLRHLLPNLAPIVLAQATLSVSGAVLAEATLAFLGLSDPTRVSWGTTLQLAWQNHAVSAGQWWVLAPPGAAIALVSLALTLLGRALEARLDPRLRAVAG